MHAVIRRNSRRRVRSMFIPVILGTLLLSSGVASAATTVLNGGSGIGSCRSISSPNGSYVLRMQCDGNLVLIAPVNRPVWASGTHGNRGAVARMQRDGNLVVHGRGNVARWASGTSGNPGAVLRVQDDGNVVITAPGNRAVWATNTAGVGTPGNRVTGEVVQLTNAARARAGCGPLRVDLRLTAAAQAHTSDMATRTYFSHTSRDGRTFDRRIRAAGYQGSRVAENIARGFTTPSAVTQAWMRSPGHRANIVNCRLTAIGVGHDSRGNYWTQDFGG